MDERAEDPLLLNEAGQLSALRSGTAPHLYRRARMGDEEEDEDEGMSGIFLLFPQFVTKDGKVLHTLTRNKVFYDQQGFPLMMVSCVEKVLCA